MSLASQVTLLATRVATECKSIRTALAGKAATVHTHSLPGDLYIPAGQVWEGTWSAPSQNIPNTFNQPISYSTVVGTASTLVSRAGALYTINTQGYYAIHASLRLSGPGQNEKYIAILVNGATVQNAGHTTLSGGETLHCSTSMLLLANDVVSIVVWQNTGVLVATAIDITSYLRINRIR